MVLNTTRTDIDITGDPFVDVGALVLSELDDRFPGRSILDHIDFAARVFVRNWGAKINTVFLNSEITQPAYDAVRKVNETKSYYDSVMGEELDGIDGWCRICGFEGKLFAAGRDRLSLSGSGAFINFHHSHEAGIYLCKHCLVKSFFIPLGVIQLSGRLGLLQVHSATTRVFWATKVIRANLDKIARGSSDRILKSDVGNPRNAIFQFANEMILELHDRGENNHLTLIEFTNFGAAPDCEIYILPNPVFAFLSIVLKRHKLDWFYFVRRHYRIKGAKWDANLAQWTVIKKRKMVPLMTSDYVNNRNDIYYRLLSGTSILSRLAGLQRTHLDNNRQKFPSMIAIHYAMEVLAMKEEQIKIIQHIADVVFDLMAKENDYKKYRIQLEGARRAFELRGALLRIIKTHFKNGGREPVIRLREYVDYLFPDGQYWGEVRDMLLVCLYEKLHDGRIDAEEVMEDEDVNETIKPTESF